MLKLAFFLKIENSRRDDNRNIDAFPIRDFFDMVGKPHRLIAETLRDDRNISRHPEKNRFPFSTLYTNLPMTRDPYRKEN